MRCERMQCSPFQNWKPTRLIKIGVHRTSLRLRLGKEVPSQVKYHDMTLSLSLSYCGGNQLERAALTKDDRRLAVGSGRVGQFSIPTLGG